MNLRRLVSLLSLFAILWGAGLPVLPAEATTVVVTITNASPVAGQTTLREAITFANNLLQPVTITFSDTTANGAINFHDRHDQHRPDGRRFQHHELV